MKCLADARLVIFKSMSVSKQKKKEIVINKLHA